MIDGSHAARLVVRGTAVTWDEIGGEVVAINLATGHYFSLRETARDVFVLLDAGLRLPEVVDVLAPGPDRRDLVAQDIERFVAALVEAGLLHGTDEDDPGSGTTVDPVALLVPGRAYAPPVLETFTDLEDLMLLDPVHDVDDQGWPRADTDA